MAGTVCLTFDFDAISVWIARNMLTPATVSRGEFGAYAIPRILQTLKSQEIPSTWFIPGHTIETYPTESKSIRDAGHEIGLHGYAHENVSALDAEAERAMFERSLQALESTLAIRPSGNRTPSWDFSPVTLDILVHLGLQYDSSLMGADYSPYYCRSGDLVRPDAPTVFGRPTSVVQVPVSWSLDDFPAFEFLRTASHVIPGLASAGSVFRNWLDDVRYMLERFDNGVVTITMHPQVIGRGHRMLGLEWLIAELQSLGVIFSTVGEVAARFRAGEKFGILRQTGAVRG